MEYIVSRNYKISTDVFESNVFFNIWIKKMWPYDDAKIGDTSQITAARGGGLMNGVP